MAIPVYQKTDPRPADYEYFIDGDLLVVSLPDIVDNELYTTITEGIENAGEGGIKQLLFDCSLMQDLTEEGLKAFIKLSHLCRQQQLRLLILDASIEISEQLDQWLPRATWVDSAEGHYPVLNP